MMYMNQEQLKWLERLIELRIKFEQTEIMTEVIVDVINKAGHTINMTRKQADVTPIKRSWIWMNIMKTTKKVVLDFVVDGIVLRKLYNIKINVHFLLNQFIFDPTIQISYL